MVYCRNISEYGWVLLMASVGRPPPLDYRLHARSSCRKPPVLHRGWALYSHLYIQNTRDFALGDASVFVSFQYLMWFSWQVYTILSMCKILKGKEARSLYCSNSYWRSKWWSHAVCWTRAEVGNGIQGETTVFSSIKIEYDWLSFYSRVLYLSISIALLTAWAFQKRSRPQQLSLCRSLHAEALQATVSEGLTLHGG